MGAKGHVQVIVPHMTESYTSQQDPVDHDVAYCTLKSFPAQIEHTIQWARDKVNVFFFIYFNSADNSAFVEQQKPLFLDFSEVLFLNGSNIWIRCNDLENHLFSSTPVSLSKSAGGLHGIYAQEFRT